MLIRLTQKLRIIGSRNNKVGRQLQSSFGDNFKHYLTDIQKRPSTFCAVTRCHVTSRLEHIMPKRRRDKNIIVPQPKLKKQSKMGAVLSLCSCIDSQEQVEKSTSEATENTALLSDKRNYIVRCNDQPTSQNPQDRVTQGSACGVVSTEAQSKKASDEQGDINIIDDVNISHIKETHVSSSENEGAAKRDELESREEEMCERDADHAEMLTSACPKTDAVTKQDGREGDVVGQAELESHQGDTSLQTQPVYAQGIDGQTELVSAQLDSSGQTEAVYAKVHTSGQTELVSQGESSGQMEPVSAKEDTSGETEFVSQGDSSGQAEPVIAKEDTSGETELVSGQGDTSGKTGSVSFQDDTSRQTKSFSSQGDVGKSPKRTVLPKQLLDSVTSNVSERCNSDDSWLQTAGLEGQDLSDSEVFGGLVMADKDTHVADEAGQAVSEKKSNKNKGREERVSKPRPNYFVAIQITNPKIHIGLGEVQRAVLSVDPRLKDVMMPLPTLHLTLYVTCLQGEEHINSAVRALEETGEELRPRFQTALPVCEVAGLGTFRNQVVFAKITPGESLDHLSHIHDVLMEKMSKHGLETTDDSSLIPHITLMKMSRAKGHFKKSVAKKIDPDLYKEFKDMTFGEMVIQSLQLCSMTKPKDVFGYYQVLHKVDLASEEITLNKFCEGLVQSALVSAVETDLYKEDSSNKQEKQTKSRKRKPRKKSSKSQED